MMSRRSMFVLLIAAAAQAFAQSRMIRVEGAWMREPPRSATTAAVYGTVVNETAKPVTIVSGKSSVAKTVEIHEMSMRGGLMHMRPVEKLVVPAQGRVELKPGGLHLMLLGITDRRAAGERITITLQTSDGQEIPVQIEVRKPETQQ